MCRRMIFLVSFVFVLALVLTNFAQADLIGYLRFDESSGIIAADSAGGDNDGILFGDQLEWTAGRSGGALSFPGVPDDARVEFLTTGMSATAGTVAMWGLLADPQPAQNRYFFGHTTQPQWANRVQLYMNDGDNLLDLGLGNSHELDTDIMELPMEEWVHVALTWDSGNYVVYVNGEDVANGTYAGLSEIHPIANIGNNGTSGPDKGFSGLLDEVRLYDHALNADNILDLLYPEPIECLIAHWKLDEIEGAIAYDSVGDNDGILYGNPIWQPMGGMLDGALEFDGDDDYVDCGTFNPSEATGQLSICLWAKWNGLNGRYQGLIGKRNSWNVNNMMWQLETRSHISGDVMFEREGYAGVAGGILTEGDWEHWCVTFDGATAIIYRMGEEVNRGAFSFGSKTDAQVVLGGSNAANPFNGALDDVRIYDCALNAAEILAAMEGVELVDPGTDGLVAYYPLENDVSDNSGNGNDGTLEDGPTFVDGQFGQALAFDGSRVAIGASDSLTADLFQGSFTLTAWINPTRTGNTWQQIFRSIRADDTSNDTLFINNGGKLSWRGRVGGGWAGGMCETAPHLVPADHWTHVAVTGDGINFRIYVNGALSEESAFQTTDGENSTYYIGGDPRWTGESYTGMIDDVRIYNMALTGLEILVAMEGVELVDVTAPGDLVQGVPNDGLTDGSRNFGWYRWESPEMAIDNNIETKYLHFKGDFEFYPGTGGTGFQVTPSAGATIVTGLTLTTANDFPGRDPIAFELSGSNESIDGPYELITSGYYIVDFCQEAEWPRLTMNATPIPFDNDTAYAHYQLLFTAIRGPVGGSVNSMQIAEVELLGVPAPAPASGGANIILVTEALDWDLDGLRDDHSLETFLISEGYSVDVRPDYWKVLTPDKIAELNAADLIIISRLAWSDRYDEGNETTDWNSLTTPLLLMNPNFARNTRWKWVNSWAGAPDDIPLIYTKIVDPLHPIFIDILLSSYDPDGLPDVVQIIDPLVGTGLISFVGTTDMGNGQLIAKPVGIEMGWIAEWDAGVEFFDGSGQYAGGRRMLFCAGTQEIQYYDYDRQEVITTAQGELNLTAEGLQMFRNAIDYLLGGAHIILVTEAIDRDSDGLRDDHSLETFLVSEGHSVDVRPEYWNVLDPDKISELNAADLIIISRLAWSTRYNQGNEATEWNSLTTPLLQMNSHFARNIRWNWINSDARAPDDTSYIYAGAVDQHHPIFQGVPMTFYDPTLRGDPLNAVEMIDPLVGAGFTAFIDGTDMGNGQFIAKPVGLEMGWIAEWDAGVEFYEGAGQYAGGKRMLFCAGTYFDPDIHEVITTTKGELNLTAEGLQMFRNAIAYLLNSDFTGGIIEPGI